MPSEPYQEETGFLSVEAGQLIIRRDDGGVWRLHAPRRVWKLAGRRVRVTGSRADFDLLDIETATPL